MGQSDFQIILFFFLGQHKLNFVNGYPFHMTGEKKKNDLSFDLSASILGVGIGSSGFWKSHGCRPLGTIKADAN